MSKEVRDASQFEQQLREDWWTMPWKMDSSSSCRAGPRSALKAVGGDIVLRFWLCGILVLCWKLEAGYAGASVWNCASDEKM